MGGLFFLDFIYLILLRGRKISMCGFLSCTPHQAPCPQTRNVPSLGIKLLPLVLNALSHTSWGFRYIFLIMLQQLLIFFSLFSRYAQYTQYTFPPAFHSPTLVHIHGSYIKVLWLLHFLYYY